MDGKLEFLSAVIVLSNDAERLARFYRDVLGMPLQPAQHGESHRHYECLLGDVHFAIHPLENHSHPSPSSSRMPRVDPKMVAVGSVKLALTTFDIQSTMKRLAEHHVEPIYPPKDIGIATMTAIRDPDGNYVEITELGKRWLEHLEARRSKGHDILRRWRDSQPEVRRRGEG